MSVCVCVCLRAFTLAAISGAMTSLGKRDPVDRLVDGGG